MISRWSRPTFVFVAGILATRWVEVFFDSINSQIDFLARSLLVPWLALWLLIEFRNWSPRQSSAAARLNLADRPTFELAANEKRQGAAAGIVAGLLAYSVFVALNVPDLRPRAGSPVTPKPAEDSRPVLVLLPAVPPPAPLPDSGSIPARPTPEVPEPTIEVQFPVDNGVTAPDIPPGLIVGTEEGDIDSNDPPPDPQPVPTSFLPSAPQNLRMLP